MAHDLDAAGATATDNRIPKKRGPKTPEGKARSAMNARKHGLRANKFFLVPHEKAEEFEQFAIEMREAYGPKDVIEQRHVESIVIAMWREMRADRLEAEVFSDIPPGYEGRGHGSDFVGKPENRASINTALRYRSQAQMELKRAVAMLDAYRKSRREVEKEKRTNEKLAASKPANENCTNELISSESKAQQPSPTPPPTSRGEFERPASGLSKRPSSQNFTNELFHPLEQALEEPDLGYHSMGMSAAATRRSSAINTL
ncbi:MAG: hypothetical protein AAFY56_07270 [Pseudomonadota bacterium]